jgi:transposase
MSAKRYTEEFKIEAVKQVTERGHPVAEVASRLGMTTHSLYQWIKRYSVPDAERETGIWTRPLRRAWLARLSPSREPVYCDVRLLA